MFKFFKKLLSPFSKIKSNLGQKIRFLFSKPIDERSYEHLEEMLYEADIGPLLAMELVDKIKLELRKTQDPQEILKFLKSELLKHFLTPPPLDMKTTPHVILMIGVNGSGKTTSLAKLAAKYHKMGKKVLIAAGDTFRAAAADQLERWADKLGVDLVKSKVHSDPSAVAFDALNAAIARKSDLVLIDTAGRLQNKLDLMQELAKLRKICEKQIPNAPHETLLVLDATVGQNALDQAKTFHKFTPITGIILTKLDGTAKGGIAVAIQKELKIPILYAGLGESEDDLVPFDPQSYIDALVKE